MLEVNGVNFRSEVSEGVVLVDFYADWCGPCRALVPTLQELTDVKVVKVNVDKNSDLATEYNVSSIPKLVLMKDGQVVDEMVGLQSKAHLQSRIDEANVGD